MDAELLKKKLEYEQRKARAKALRLRLTCTICGARPKKLLNCPCETTQYCSVACQKVDWRERGHREACKKIRAERAAEAARAEAPTPRPSLPVYGPAPRSHADEVRARIAAEHEAARARREANPEPEPLCERYGGRCPICMEEWDVNENPVFLSCCCRTVCQSCLKKSLDGKLFGTGARRTASVMRPCPLCRAPTPRSEAELLARVRRHVENDLPEAMDFLGIAYRDGGLGLVKSAKKAAKIFKRAAELGNLSATLNLATLYLYGDGVKLNTAKAMQLFRLVGNRGHGRQPALAQRHIGQIFEDSSRHDEALHWYKMAAEQGYTRAESNVGHLILKVQLDALYDDYGDDYDADYDAACDAETAAAIDEARPWLQRAADKGHEKSIESLRKISASIELSSRPIPAGP